MHSLCFFHGVIVNSFEMDKTLTSTQPVRSWFSSPKKVRDSDLNRPLLTTDPFGLEMNHKLSHEMQIAAGNGIDLHHTPTKRVASTEIDIEIGNSGDANETNTDHEKWTKFKLMTWNLWCIPISSPRCLSNPDRCSTYLRALAESKNWSNYDGLIVVALQEFSRRDQYPLRFLFQIYSQYISICFLSRVSIHKYIDYGVGKQEYFHHSFSELQLSSSLSHILVCQ